MSGHLEDARPAPSRSWLTLALLSLAACAAIAAGAWGITRDRGGDHSSAEAPVAAAAPDPSWLPANGGFMRLDSVSEKATPAHAKHIALADTDLVPDDVRRLFVGITVAAIDGPISVDPTAFEASGPGLLPVAATLADFEATAVPAGSSLSGYVVFDVPREERLVELRVPGLAEPLRIVADGNLVAGATPTPAPAPVAPGDVGEHGHG